MIYSKTKLICEISVWVLIVFIIQYFVGDRSGFSRVITQYLPNLQASMLVAMLWGDTSGISKEFYNQMVKTGLIHILVVSGSNLMIVVKGLIELLAQWVGRKRSIIFGIVMGWTYVNLVGWQIPAIRAVVMVTVLYTSQLLGRKINLIRMLILVLIIMLVADYRVLTMISFWMSFLAFMAVSISPNDGVFKTTIRVNMWLLPILAWKFGVLSLISPISNLLTLFLVETITVLGFVGLFFKPVLWLLYPLLVYVQKIVELLSAPPFFQLYISFNWIMMISCYVIGIGYYLKKNDL